MIKILLQMILLAGIVIYAACIPKHSFAASICYNQRSISMHICQTNPELEDTCIWYQSPCLGQGESGGGFTKIEAEKDCRSKCWGRSGLYPSRCGPGYCIYYRHPTYCQAQSYLAQCHYDESSGTCQAYILVSTCHVTGTTCTQSSSDTVYGCWGPGPDGPPPTPPPGGTPTPQYWCGNGICDVVENCSTCVGDCGVCPVGVAVQARAWKITNADTSCNAVYSSTTPIVPTTLSATGPDSLAAQTQTTDAYVSWSDAAIGIYTVSSAPPAGYVLRAACWKRDVTAPLTGTGMSAIVNNTETLQWDLGYTLGAQWSQVQGGDVYAATNLISYIPSTATPRAFILDGMGGYPGVATYGQDYNFDSSGLTHGETSYTSLVRMASSSSQRSLSAS